MNTAVKATNYSREKIEDLAVMLGEGYDVYDQYGQADVLGLMNKLGGQIVQNTVIARRSPLVVDRDKSFVIVFEDGVIGTKRLIRHEVARGLGHLQLHVDDTELFQGACIPPSRGASGGRAGVEATWFAHSLLMPKRYFEKAHFNKAGEVNALMDVFDIGEGAVRARCEMLQLTTA